MSRCTGKTRTFGWELALSYLRMMLLILIPIAVSWDFGGVLPWTQWAMMIGCAALLLITLPRLIVNPQRMPLTATFLILGLTVWLLAQGQTWRLPHWAVRFMSSGSAMAYGEMIPDSVRQEASASGDDALGSLAESSHPISVASSLTRASLTIPIAFTTFFLAAAITINSPIRLYISAVALVFAGAATSFLGVVDRLQPKGYASKFLVEHPAMFAAFINRNNAAGYLNLALAVSVGLIVWRYLWQREQRPWDDRFDVEHANWIELLMERFRRVVSYADATVMFLLLGSIAIFSGILICGSRGGFVGALVGSVVVIWRAVSRTQTFTSTFTFFLVSIVTGLFLGFLGMLEQVRNRLGTLFGSALTSDGRWDHWRDGLRAAWHYLPSGSGMGTYRYAYLPYQETSAGGWFLNADNLYLELLVEGGLWLPLLLFSMACVVFTALQRLVERQHDPVMAGVTATVWFALAAMGVSQVFDFGLLLPANYLTFALITGALVGKADRLGREPSCHRQHSSHESDELTGYFDNCRTHDDFDDESASEDSSDSELESSNEVSEFEDDEHASDSTNQVATWHNIRANIQRLIQRYSRLCERPRWILALACVLLLLNVNCIIELAQRATLDYWHRAVENLADLDVVQLDTVIQIRKQVQSLVKRNYNDYTARNTLAEAILFADRSAAAQATLSDTSTQIQGPLVAWQLSHIDVRRAVYYSGSIPVNSKAKDVLLPGQSLSNLQDARLQAIGALLACPLDDTSRQILLKLDFIDPLVEDVTSATLSGIWVEQLSLLRKNWSLGLHRLALLALVRPGPEVAFPLWQRVLTLEPEGLKSVWRDVKPLVSDSAFAEALPNDIDLLLRFAVMSDSALTRSAVLTRAGNLLDETAVATLPSGVHNYWRARLAELRGQPEVAVWHYAIAIQNNPSKTLWRYQYARALRSNGKSDLAIEQIRRCILQQPQEIKYQIFERELRKL